ncbi:MAG: RnfABCDGE type electron transport complex subunit B [Lachnospiraceae bacterium]|nr:RnfABCDGE type electron transport complex subunit B [Lachnospiraceae bacterium]
MIQGIMIAALIVGAIGIFIGLFLGIAGLKFKVEVDPKEEAVQGVLPGNNCGGCGFPGCSGLAVAIAKGEAPVNGCPVGGDEVAAKVAEIMGVEAQNTAPMVAYVHCQGDCEKAKSDYVYTGVEDCRMAAFVPNGGPKACNSGCLGYGTCVKECPFDAIHIVNGIAVVDDDKCKACGKCVAVCPKQLIGLVPKSSKIRVACSSTDKGPVAMKLCDVACIGCGICVKNCPNEAIGVENFHAIIDYEKCTGCGICKEKCPKKAIVER